MRRVLAILALALLPTLSLAVQPDEVLPDAALEARAREISQKLRCPVCQGENIDESNAPISRDLRLYVRERLVAGDSNPQVIEAVTDRFGEFVLFEPPARGANLLLWLAGPLMALLALLVGWRFLRARERAETAPLAPLSDQERARLKAIMGDVRE
ncbi:cytochrome c-type biogenesis protein [uncultured Paracoccus sp.]|uniref:cytochrome c-type biogenesis protein n=1 Tax=uncultured Paracoccus sp. TaxID=189685 RepID=UPI0026188F44|nr:cytochrome c-type biogenesis protein [uncultured Paracoccus sp.]